MAALVGCRQRFSLGNQTHSRQLRDGTFQDSHEGNHEGFINAPHDSHERHTLGSRKDTDPTDSYDSQEKHTRGTREDIDPTHTHDTHEGHTLGTPQVTDPNDASAGCQGVNNHGQGRHSQQLCSDASAESGSSSLDHKHAVESDDDAQAPSSECGQVATCGSDSCQENELSNQGNHIHAPSSRPDLPISRVQKDMAALDQQQDTSSIPASTPSSTPSSTHSSSPSSNPNLPPTEAQKQPQENISSSPSSSSASSSSSPTTSSSSQSLGSLASPNSSSRSKHPNTTRLTTGTPASSSPSHSTLASPNSSSNPTKPKTTGFITGAPASLSSPLLSPSVSPNSSSRSKKLSSTRLTTGTPASSPRGWVNPNELHIDLANIRRHRRVRSSTGTSEANPDSTGGTSGTPTSRDGSRREQGRRCSGDAEVLIDQRSYRAERSERLKCLSWIYQSESAKASSALNSEAAVKSARW